MKITCQTEAHHSVTFQCVFPTTVTFSSTTTTKPSISGNEHLIHAAFAPGHYSNFTQCPSVVLHSKGSQFRITQCFKLLCLFMCVCVCVCVFMHAKPLQSCLTLCNARDCSLPGSSVHGDSPGKNTGVSCHSVRGPSQPRWNLSPASHALAGRFFITAPPGKPIISL